jgi:hypothetical protein
MIRIKTIEEDGKVVEKRFVHTNYAQSKPRGKCKFQPQLTLLTNEKFMSAAQKRAHQEGQEIWV